MSAVTDPISSLLGGGKSPSINVTAPQDTAQQEADKAQRSTNAALARKKNRSLLSTGANSSDTGTAGAAQAAKKLLGE